MTHPDPMQVPVDPLRVIGLLQQRITAEVSRSVTLEAQLMASQDRERALSEQVTQLQAEVSSIRFGLPEDQVRADA